MIQVDVFWSFAMGVCFAVAGAEGIKRSSSMFINKYFVYTVCFLSMIFAPSGIYLLWHHTGWETMFLLDKSLHGIWPCLFAVTNVLNGVLGFCMAYSMIQSGDENTPHTMWTSAYTCMFAVLTFGYDRFLYAGSEKDWAQGKQYALTDFFHCEVFYALVVMSIFVLPPIYYSCLVWPREYPVTGPSLSATLQRALLSYGCETTIVVAIYHTLCLAEVLPKGWGYDRLAAFMVGQIIFGLLIFWPLAVHVLMPPKEHHSETVGKSKRGKKLE